MIAALLPDALGGVADEIDEHLLELLRIGAKGRFVRARFDGKLDVVLRQFRREQLVDFAQQCVGSELCEIRITGTGEEKEVGHDAIEAFDLIIDESRRPPVRARWDRVSCGE